MKEPYLLLDSDKYDHVKMDRSKRRKETIRPRSKNMKRPIFKKEHISKALYYIAVLAIIVGAFLFFNKLNKTSNTIKLNQLELKSTQYKLRELNSSYDKVLQEKASTEAEKASQDQRVQELEKAKTELEKQLQSKLAEKARVASIQGAVAYAAVSNCGDNQYAQFIYMKESGCRLGALGPMTNLGQACGIGQSLPCSKLANVCPNWQQDYACQNSFFSNYVSRYGGWGGAYNFWVSNHWY